MTRPVPFVGQILDSQDGDMAHSFITLKSGGAFICFDKAGFKKPFTVYELGDLMKHENYRNQKWRFVPIDDGTPPPVEL